jgi:hypothetical protein
MFTGIISTFAHRRVFACKSLSPKELRARQKPNKIKVCVTSYFFLGWHHAPKIPEPICGRPAILRSLIIALNAVHHPKSVSS